LCHRRGVRDMNLERNLIFEARQSVETKA